jgi:hypothetical protein
VVGTLNVLQAKGEMVTLIAGAGLPLSAAQQPAVVAYRLSA